MEKPLSRRAKYKIVSLLVISDSKLWIYKGFNLWFNAVVQ
jgi:hypothetical protein